MTRQEAYNTLAAHAGSLADLQRNTTPAHVCARCRAQKHDACTGVCRANHGIKYPCRCRTCARANATSLKENHIGTLDQ